MILLLLLCLAAAVTAQSYPPCPVDSACLYHFGCSETFPNTSARHATLDPLEKDAWKEKNCKKSFYISTFLGIRPLSNHKWNISFESTDESVVIQFDDSLTMMANQSEPIFKINSESSIKIPIEITSSEKFQFTVDSSKKKLLDIFKESKIYYEDKIGSDATSSVHPLFWDKVHELTPCDSSLIIEDCTKEIKNCTELNIESKSVKCLEEEGKMWLKAENSSWNQLNSVFCVDKKEWSLKDKNGSIVDPPEGSIEIRCAVEEPEPWADSATGLKANEKLKRAKDEKKKEGPFSLLDSPFVWVGIGLVGLIAIAAVVLASVYAYRKLRKNQPMDRSGVSKKVNFKPLPTEGSSYQTQTGSSNSGSEMDLGNADQTSTQQNTTSVASKAPAPQEVSRADGPTANTVNRLSLIKTIEGTSPVVPIPAPSSN